MQEKIKLAGTKFRQWVKSNVVFTAMLVVESLVVFYFIAQIFAPTTVIEVPLASFVEAYCPNGVVVTEDGLTIANTTGEATPFLLELPAVTLSAGAYHIHVSYESLSNPENPTLEVSEHVAAIYCDSTFAEDETVESNLIEVLYDTNKAVEGHIWRDGSVAQDVFSLYYSGTGQITITSFQIEEQVAWRLFPVLIALLCSIAVNILYYACAAKYLSKDVAQGHITAARTTVLLVVVALVASAGFFSDTIYNGHDIEFHLGRIASVAQELSYGQFPVRIMTGMLNGYSYVNPLFYCDIFLYLPAVLYLWMLPLQTAYQVYAVSVSVATCFIAYYSFQKISNHRLIGYAGALLYTMASYRLTNVYVRTAVGEYTAMAFFPLVVLGFYQVYQAKKPRYQDWLPLSIGMVGILQSHVLSLEMVMFFLVLLCVITLKQILQIARIKALVCAVLLCMGLGAWYWVPFVESFVSMELSAIGHIVETMQERGISVAQLFDIGNYTKVAGASMPLEIGWGLLLGVVVILICVWQGIKKGYHKQLSYQAMIVLLCFGAIASAFVLKVFPWTAIGYGLHEAIATVVNTIQYPWRYLAIADICFVSAIVLMLMLLRQYHQKCFKPVLLGLCAVQLLLGGQFYRVILPLSEQIEWLTYETTETRFIGAGEYLMEDAEKIESYYTLVLTTDETLIVTDYRKEAGIAYITCENTSDIAQTVILPIWNYPHYQAVDRQTNEAYTIVSGETAKMEITLPAGYQGTIQIEYVAPWYWHIAELITLLSWGFVGVMAYRNRKKAVAETASLPEETLQEESLQEETL